MSTDDRRYERSDAHNQAERFFFFLDAALGSISLIAIVSIGAIATTMGTLTGGAKVAIIAMTTMGAISSALQVQLRVGPAAVAHLATARRYSALRRRVEEALENDAALLSASISEIRQQWDLVAGAAPNVPQRIRHWAKRTQAGDLGYPGRGGPPRLTSS